MVTRERAYLLAAPLPCRSAGDRYSLSSREKNRVNRPTCVGIMAAKDNIHHWYRTNDTQKILNEKKMVETTTPVTMTTPVIMTTPVATPVTITPVTTTPVTATASALVSESLSATESDNKNNKRGKRAGRRVWEQQRQNFICQMITTLSRDPRNVYRGKGRRGKTPTKKTPARE